ncbi:MAG: CehA/McbA family metallohydrolase [Candidatus Aenigmarchaeota archaeon]|nr:CehA/McbA family metallohydrolase [Candidatus Aenigmarchaeota archaeon]
MENSGRFEFHCHSHYSHGRKIRTEAIPSPLKVVRKARELGLSGIALTDHDSVEGHREAREEAKRLGLLFIPGVEISTSAGHLLALGVEEPISPGMGVRETVDRVHDCGGIAIGDHPFDMLGLGMRLEMRHTDAIEVHNALNMNKVSNWIAERQARKMGKPMVAGSDAHTLEMVGAAPNILKDVGGVDDILKAIRKGNLTFERGYVPVEEIVDWSRLRLAGSYLEVLEYVRKNYSPPRAWLAERLMKKFVRSYSRFWGYLGEFGYACSRPYSRVKMRHYW